MDGVSRQGSAVVQSGDWSEALTSLQIPTAVIHGRADRLVKIDAALEIARPLWNEYVSIFLLTLSRAKAA